MMGMSPATFWDLSLPELNLAIEGFREFHGGKKQKAMTKDELKELMEVYPD